ncbi:MAG TPA: GAP family protein [Gaiellaceae bacterium]|jgi:cytochrome c biogenesis protein CcdA|nr:GAP family protein [Gaiellaceae bacterium]
MGVLFRLALVSLSVGLADSLSPETVGPALLLATGPKRIWRVMQFTLGVFVVYFAVGVVLLTGPGRWLIGFVPNPQGTVRHVIEIVAGVVLLACGAALWFGRRRLGRRELPGGGARGGSSFVAGATIAAVGMPTAVPYLAVIAGIVASSATIPQEVVLLLIYNVAVVVPLLAIVVILLVAGKHADRPLATMASWLQRQWPVVLAILLLLIGSILILLGGAGVLKN